MKRFMSPFNEEHRRIDKFNRREETINKWANRKKAFHKFMNGMPGLFVEMLIWFLIANAIVVFIVAWSAPMP